MTDKKQTPINPQVVRTRGRVFEATLELAAESGILACTFDAVSERSGVARSTLYRHWSNQAELMKEAVNSQDVVRVAPETGSLRDDMLISMLDLGRSLDNSVWGELLPQLLASAFIDPDMDHWQKKDTQFHQAIDEEIINRAKSRGEINEDEDEAYLAMLFAAPIFYRKLIERLPIDPLWVTSHIDKTISLLIKE